LGRTATGKAPTSALRTPPNRPGKAAPDPHRYRRAAPGNRRFSKPGWGTGWPPLGCPGRNASFQYKLHSKNQPRNCRDQKTGRTLGGSSRYQTPRVGGSGGREPPRVSQAGGLGGGSPPRITYSCQFLVPKLAPYQKPTKTTDCCPPCAKSAGATNVVEHPRGSVARGGPTESLMVEEVNEAQLQN
jgi:hypothetical protein